MSTLKFKKVATVAANRFELPEEKEFFIKFISAITVIDCPAVMNKDGTEKEPASTMPSAFVTDLITGKIGQLVLSQVLNDAIIKEYPNTEHVNRCFRIVKHKVNGKRYFSYEVDEIEVEHDPEPPLSGEPITEAKKKPKQTEV
jgi:hypothetical protein